MAICRQICPRQGQKTVILMLPSIQTGQTFSPEHKQCPQMLPNYTAPCRVPAFSYDNNTVRVEYCDIQCTDKQTWMMKVKKVTYLMFWFNLVPFEIISL